MVTAMSLMSQKSAVTCGTRLGRKSRDKASLVMAVSFLRRGLVAEQRKRLRRESVGAGVVVSVAACRGLGLEARRHVLVRGGDGAARQRGAQLFQHRLAGKS